MWILLHISTKIALRLFCPPSRVLPLHRSPLACRHHHRTQSQFHTPMNSTSSHPIRQIISYTNQPHLLIERNKRKRNFRLRCLPLRFRQFYPVLLPLLVFRHLTLLCILPSPPRDTEFFLQWFSEEPPLLPLPPPLLLRWTLLLIILRLPIL